MRAEILLAATVVIGLVTLGSPQAYAQGQTRYIRDWISVPLHASADPNSSIIQSGLRSGTPLVVLENDTQGSTRVRTESGKEGWIRTGYLSTDPGAASKLEDARNELKDLKKLNDQLKLGAPSVAILQDRLKRQDTDAETKIKELNDEIDALKKRIGDNTKLVRDHSALTQRAGELQNEVNRLKAKVVELSSGTQQEYFRDGAIAVFAGAILTLLGANFWPRKRRSDWA